VSSGDRRAGRGSELFFVHLGSFVAVAVYFALHALAGVPEKAVRIALPVALAVMSGPLTAGSS